MTVFIYLLGFIWSLRIFGNLLSFIHLWFIKEYRFDRMFIHFGTPQGKRLLFLPFRRPPISPKTIALTFFVSICLVAIFAFVPGHLLLRLLLIDLMTFPLVSFWVALMKLPTRIWHQYQIHRARILLKAHAPMRVIGITGSYGKTSTKEFLATILAAKYKALKTEMSKNSPIGIAEVVIAKLRPEHEVFIVEMGAYKKGEIAQMAQIVQPGIGVITAINPQHQDLFKTIEQTMEAKYELIQNLVGAKIGIFNLDDERTKKMMEWAVKKGDTEVWGYSRHLTRADVRLVYAQNIKNLVDRIEFTAVYKKEKVAIVAQVLGKHQVSNILAAITVAVNCGMTLREIGQAARQIVPFTKTMESVVGIKGAHFINDTFNNNPDAAKAALDFLGSLPGKKILVFQPMIELGAFTDSAHEEVGAYAGRICDEIYLTNDNFNKPFLQGVQSVDKDKPVYVLSTQESAKNIKKQLDSKYTVLFKGKEAENVLRALKK